jgi:hypothetical protein
MTPCQLDALFNYEKINLSETEHNRKTFVMCYLIQ